MAVHPRTAGARGAAITAGVGRSGCAMALALAGLAGATHAQGVGVTSGTVLWTDAQGLTHPARRVRVDTHAVWQAPWPPWDALVYTNRVWTNLVGAYVSTYPLPDLPARYVAVGARVHADSGGGFPSAGYVYPYPIQPRPPRPPPWTPDLPPPDLTYSMLNAREGSGGILDLTLGNTTAAGRAFSIADALYTGWYFSSQVRAAAAPELPVVFPAPAGDGTAYFPPALGGPDIRVIADDWPDWDVVLHEYGHYLSDIDDMDQNPGGDHSFGVSNIPARGKPAGTRLAWGEGLATYLGIAAQHVNRGAQNLPTTMAGVGDTRYWDTIDQNIDVDLETHANNLGVTERGEGDELSVARILWDIADGANEPHDRISVGHVPLYNVLNNNIAGLNQLDNVWDHYFSISTDAVRKDFGAIFEEYGVSPRPTGASPINVSLLTTGPAPTFEWLKGNNNANDLFELIVFNSDFTARILDIDVPGDVSTYTLTNPQWNTLRNLLGSLSSIMFNFVVTGSDTTTFTTGAYWSDAYNFFVIPAPSTAALAAFVLALGTRRRRTA